MNGIKRVWYPFTVRRGEAGIVLTLMLLYFFLGIAFSFSQAAGYALFLDRFDVDQLPYAYMTMGGALLVIGIIYLQLSKRLRLTYLIFTLMALLTTLSVLLRVGNSISDAPWLTFILPMWYLSLTNLGNIVVWTLAGQLVHVRQSKRLYGFIGAGRWLGFIVAGFSVPLLVQLVGTLNLLTLSGISVGVALIVYLVVAFRYGDKLASDTGQVSTSDDTASVEMNLFRNGYVLLTFLLVALWLSTHRVVGQLFYVETTQRFSGADELAAFLGTFLALISIAIIGLNVFVVAPFIKRFGLRTALLFTPLFQIVVFVVFMAADLAGATALLFVLASSGRFLNFAFAFSFDYGSFQILFQLLPTKQRMRAVVISETVVEPMANTLIGLVLLVLVDSRQFALVALLLLGLWGLVAIATRRRYPSILTQMLAKRRLGQTETDLDTEGTQVVLQQMLATPDAEAVIHAMAFLQEANRAQLIAALPALVEHPADEVRHQALLRVESWSVKDAYPTICRLMQDSPSPETKEMLLRARAVLDDGEETREQLVSVLDSSDSRLQRGGLIGLLRGGSLDGILLAGEKMVQLQNSDDPADRILVAQVVGQMGLRNLHQTLVNLLQDENLSVRRAALEAISSVQHPRLWPLAIDAVNDVRLRDLAVQALAKAGDDALFAIRDAFASDMHAGVLIHLARACARINTDQSATLLADHIAHEDGQVRLAIFKALTTFNCAADDVARTHFEQLLSEEMSYTTWLLQAGSHLATDPNMVLIHEAFDEELTGIRERVYCLLVFKYGTETVAPIRDSLLHTDSRQRSYALEFLDGILSQDLKAFVLPLFEHLTARDLSRYLVTERSLQPLDVAVHLHSIVDAPHALAPGWLCDIAQHYLNQLSPEGAPTASVIECINVLYDVEMLAGIPVSVLLDIAGHVRYLTVGSGRTIFEKGDLGRSMYIVVAGTLRVHDEDYELEILQSGSVFGEMALLDPEPRVASITALEDTALFRLDQESFTKLMVDHAEIGRGIIRVLIGRLRERARDVVQLQAQLDAI